MSKNYMKQTFILIVLLICQQNLVAQRICPNSKLIYDIDTSYLPSNHLTVKTLTYKKVELHFREYLNGDYKIYFNDSLLFSGVLYSDSTKRFDKQYFTISIVKGENVIRINEVSSGNNISFKLNILYPYCIVIPWDYCSIVVQSTYEFNGQVHY